MNDTEISLKFKNSVTGEKKLEEYEKRLQSIYSFINGLNNGQTKAFSKIQGATKDLDKEVKTTNKSIDKLGDQFSLTFDVKALSTYFKALYNVSKQLTSLISASSNYIENVNLLEVAYHNANETIEESSSRIEDFIAKMADVYGLDESRLTRQFGIFKQLANAMKLPADEAERLSELMVKMTNDVASLYNLSLERASNALQSALVGQVRPIRGATGADITEKTLQQTVDKLGLEQSISDLSFVEKRLIMVISLTDQLKNSQGDYARTIESASNQIRVMHEQWDRLSRAVGNVFYPILAKVLPYVNAVLMVLTDIANLIASLFGFEMPEFDYSSLSATSDAVMDLEDSLNGASSSADKLKQKMSGLRSFDKLNVISTPKSSGNDGVGSGINPKIMDAFNEAFSKYDDMLDNVRMKAREIRDAIEDWLGFTDGSYKNLKLIGAVLGAIIGLKLLKGIVGLITGTSRLGKALGTGGLYGALKKIWNLKKDGKLISTVTTKLTTLIPIVLRVTSAIAGAILTIKGGIDIFGSFKAEMDKVTISTKKLAIGFAEMTAGGALIGTAIAPGIGTLIGALVGGLGGAVLSIKAYNDAQEEMLKKNVFGTLNVSVKQFTEFLNNSGIAIESVNEKYKTIKTTIEGLDKTFNDNYNTLGLYGIRFGTLSQQIADEDLEKINTALTNTTDSAKEIVSNTTDYLLQNMTDFFAKGTSLTEEDQKHILDSIYNNGESQKTEIQKIQDRVTEIYATANAEKRGLRDEEYQEVLQHLQRLRELEIGQTSYTNSELEYLKEQFNQNSLDLDEQSYSNWKKARDKFEKDQKKIIQDNYDTQYNTNKKLLDNKLIDEQQYNKLQADLMGQRKNDEKNLADALKGYDKDISKQLKETYNDLEKRSKELTGKQKKDVETQMSFVEKTLKKMGQWETDTKKTADNIKQNLQNPTKDPIKFKLQLDDRDFKNKWNSVAKQFNKGNKTATLRLDYGLQGLPSLYADGGLPPVGQLFVANESGAELVGNLGGQSFVANQNQVVDLLDRKLGEAKSQPMNATFVIQVGSKEVARQVITDLQGMAKSNGKPITIG